MVTEGKKIITKSIRRQQTSNKAAHYSVNVFIMFIELGAKFLHLSPFRNNKFSVKITGSADRNPDQHQDRMFLRYWSLVQIPAGTVSSATLGKLFIQMCLCYQAV